MSSTVRPDTDTTADGGPVLDPRRWLALTVIAIAQLMVVLDASIVTIALPSAQKALHISDADRQWVVTAYTLAFGGLLLLGGRIADFVGRKRIFVIGLIGFALASALGGVAQNAVMLYAARALQGAFAAILAPAALSLVTVTFTESKERARAFGVYGAISGGGAAIGLVLGGLLTEYASWRWCLLVNIFIAVPTALAAVSIVTESKAEGDRHYDLPGAILATLGLASLVYGFTEAAKPGKGWLAGTTVSFIIVGAVLLAGFVAVELRAKHPLLPMRVVLDRNRGGSFLVSFLIGAGIFAIFLFLSYYFQINLGYSPLKSGLAFLPFSAGIIFSAGLVSQLLPRIGPRIPMLIGCVLASAGMLMLLAVGQGTSFVAVVLPAQLLMSVGMGFVFVPMSSLALVGVHERDAGVASALLNTTQQIGGALGTALLNTLYASAVTSYTVAHLHSSLKPGRLHLLALIHGYHVAFAVGAGLLISALVAATVFINAKRDDVQAVDAGVGAVA